MSVVSIIITNYTDDIFGGLLGCAGLMENFQIISTIMRDFAFILFISMGIYSHKSTLVNRFITHERSQLQQRQLAKVFHEQPDGLVVLKQRIQEVTPPVQSQLEGTGNNNNNSHGGNRGGAEPQPNFVQLS